MKHLVLVAMLASVCSFSVRADEASHRAAVEELMVQTRTETMVQNLRAQLDRDLQQMVDNTVGPAGRDKLNAGQKTAIDKFLQNTKALMGESLAWPRLQETMVKIYTQAFTEDEIRQLTAFYSTPIGIKSVEKMPEITAASMRSVRDQMQAMIPKLQQIGQEFNAEFTQASGKPAAPPAPPGAAPAKKKPASR